MRKVVWLTGLALSLGLTTPTLAQTAVNWNPEGLQLSRTELTELLAQLDAVLESSAYSGALRASAERDQGRIQQRLDVGDFSIGDRIILHIEGEVGIPDSIPVGPGPRITLPVIGDISLVGVLRSELENHLTTELGRFIQAPKVTARSLIRLSIQGTVLRPGFYAVPSETLLSDAIMIAGGPSPTADMEQLQLMRGAQILWEGDELQSVITDGRTLDQMSLRAGDQLVIPAKKESGFWRSAGVLLGTMGSAVIVALVVGRGN